MGRTLRGSTVAERLTLNSVRDGACLRWTGAHTPKGYGQMRVDGARKAVHRLAYVEWVGPIPDGNEVDHVHARGCRFRDCIEPQHLEAVTHAENVRRQIELIVACPKGHLLTPENRKVSRNKRGYLSRQCRRCFNDWRIARRAALQQAKAVESNG